MDVNSIGMVDYTMFKEALEITIVSQPKLFVPDNFNWEEKVISDLKDYIRKNQVTTEEAFKTFDRDFDGKISKADLKWVIQNILNYEEEIQPTKLERLYQLLDFYKSGQIQLSDIERLVSDENPYRSSAAFSGTKFANSTTTFQWRNNALQQIGLGLSKQFPSLSESFEQISERSGKIDFNSFSKFLDNSRLLNGFNLTKQLQQQLFSEIDSHKKGFITENDWLLAFSQFNYSSQTLIELQNALSVSFTDSQSAFEYFLGHSKGKQITRDGFVTGFRSLTNNRFNVGDLNHIWSSLSSSNKMTREQFREHFEGMQYRGTSTLKKSTLGKTMMVTANSSNVKWENDILEKIKSTIKASPYNVADLFKQMDTDNSGKLSAQEFRNGIRKLGIGLSSREIDQIMIRIDANQDGMICYKEFMAKFSDQNARKVDKLIQERANNKMAQLKEMMHLHMTCPIDAFNRFDTKRTGYLSYDEFSALISKLHQLHNEPEPTYQVLKDLFDLIDVRKDGQIDQHEWKKSFERVSVLLNHVDLERIHVQHPEASPPTNS